MSLVILKELVKYTIDPNIDDNNLIKIFNLEDDKTRFDKIINELNNTTFLRHNKSILDISDLSTNYNQQNDEEDSEDISEQLQGKETYIFTFVGIIFVMGITIIIYPKYIEDINLDVDNGYLKFKQILRVISLYHKRQEQRIMLTTGDDSIEQNKLSIAIQLLEYYAENGLYTIQNDIVEEDSVGYIHWEKTINETPTILSGISPLYLSPFTETTIINELHIIRLIQLAILNDIKAHFKDILFFLDYTVPEESQLLLDELDDVDTLIYHLDKEYYSQFVSHKIELINLLKLYLTNSIRESDVSSIEVFGVSQFHPVWEDVCKKVYKDHLDLTLKELNLKPVNKLSSTTKLKEVVAPPVWFSVANNKNYPASKSLQLDVLHVDSNKKIFHIYDGKYYLIKFEGETVKHAPGVGDITKQYLYEQAYKSLAEKNNYTFTNQFIIPKDNLLEDKGEGVLFAEVSLPLFDSFNLSSIKVTARDCELIFKEYLLS